jgi:hypothetical protein
MTHLLLLFWTVYGFNTAPKQQVEDDLLVASRNFATKQLAFDINYSMFGVNSEQIKLVDKMHLNGCKTNFGVSYFNNDFATWNNDKYTVSINHESKHVVVSRIYNYDNKPNTDNILKYLGDSTFSKNYHQQLVSNVEGKRMWRLSPLKQGGQMVYIDFTFDQAVGLITSLSILYDLTFADYFGYTPDLVDKRSKIKLEIEMNYSDLNHKKDKCFNIEDWVLLSDKDVSLKPALKNYKLYKLLEPKKRK